MERSFEVPFTVENWFALYEYLTFIIIFFVSPGLIENMEDIVDEEDPDHEPFPNLEDKIVPFLGLNKTRRRCKEGEYCFSCLFTPVVLTNDC